MDLDHFIAARSLKLHQATSLQKRPLLHNTPLTFVITIGVYATFKWTFGDQKFAVLSSLCLFNAWITHQLRDALRRGLWLYPIWTDTAALSISSYLMCLLVLFLFEVVVLEAIFKSFETIAIVDNIRNLIDV